MALSDIGIVCLKLIYYLNGKGLKNSKRNQYAQKNKYSQIEC